MVSKPDLDLITSEDPVASQIYTRQAIGFQRGNSNLLWKGKFVDEQGFSIQACTTIVTKAFVWDYLVKVKLKNLEYLLVGQIWMPLEGKKDIANCEFTPLVTICNRRLLTWDL